MHHTWIIPACTEIALTKVIGAVAETEIVPHLYGNGPETTGLTGDQ